MHHLPKLYTWERIDLEAKLILVTQIFWLSVSFFFLVTISLWGCNGLPFPYTRMKCIVEGPWGLASR